MLLPILSTTLTLIAALWLLRIAATRATTRASSSTPALGTGLALALPLIAAATHWQWLAEPRETRLALIAIAAIPIAIALLATSAALLSTRHHDRTPTPRWLPIAAAIIAAVLIVIAASESVRLIDAQALGLFAIVGWWWTSLRRPHNSNPPPTTTPPPARATRQAFLAPVALATIAAFLAAADWRSASIALIAWAIAAAGFLRPMIARSNWAPPIGLAAGAPALGLGWLGIVESLRLINAVHREAIAIGIQPNWLERLYLAAEALGTTPTLPDTALLATPAAALAALALFIALNHRTESHTPPRPTPWRAGAVAGVWLVVALALVLPPAVLTLR